MYKLFLYSSVCILITFIILSGVGSTPIKVVLGIIGLTFIPQVRKKLYKTPLVIIKSKVALYTSLFLTLLMIFPDIDLMIKEPNSVFSGFTISILIFSSSLLGTIIYGIPVSLFSDLITANVKKYRFYISFLVHMGFGLLSFFFLGPLMNVVTICAILFFLIDELCKKKKYFPYEI
ncbi:hypothetical protein [Rossellomorea aquimaris]|uniref:hypothetical protein n=1 Tax=Rossellomorea aquimaris TaxID=189382 RepID=UPI0007D08674|nr:hypothetical protein [Rossellomorea aquimaris]